MTRKILFLCLFIFIARLSPADHDGYKWLRDMMSKDDRTRRAAADKIIKAADASLVAGMIDTYFYMPRKARGEMRAILKRLTGDDAGENYYDWVEYIGRRADLKPAPGYVGYKVSLLAMIDPRYKEILYENVTAKIRPEEIVWGGATLDGIPPIDKPRLIQASQAELQESEKIFGVSLKGEHRAYPLRYLSWHEMLNDRIQDEPFTISF
jgi:hypothetical protein